MRSMHRTGDVQNFGIMRSMIDYTAWPESFPAIEKLYERGVFDYLSVSLWCDYLNFVQEHEPSVRECSPAGVLKARNLFERALTAAGLHVTEGYKIWEAYKEFELAIFYVIDETDVELPARTTPQPRPQASTTQCKPTRVRVSTQLFMPTTSNWNHNLLVLLMDGAALERGGVADGWVLMAVEGGWSGVTGQDVSDMERLQEYMAYLKFEESCGDPARVQILYERAVTEFPISNDLWLDYTRYLDRTLKASSIVKDVYSRATKNCPWVGELWVRYLLSLERGRASEKEMSSYLDIFLTRVDGLRRRISQAGEVEDVLDYALIRETFQPFIYASFHVSCGLPLVMGSILDMDQIASPYSAHLITYHHTSRTWNGLLRIHSYWAQLELSLGKDLVAARGVWESLLKISGSMLDAWQGYIAMEIQMGNINEARSLYRRCYSKRFSGTGSEVTYIVPIFVRIIQDICHAWLRFEREFGTLEDFDHAVQKVTPRLENLHLFRLQQESINNGVATNQRESSSKKISREKRKQGSNIADEQPTAKRRKDTAPNKMKGHGEDKATYNDIHRFFSDVGGIVAIRILKDKYTGKSRGLAYVDFSDDAHLAAAVAKNKKMLMGKRLSIARSDPKQRRMRESSGRHTPAERDHGEMAENTKEQTSALGESDSKDSSVVSEGASGSQPQSTNPRHEDGNVQLKGKNTFAVPRAIRPLGWVDKNKSKTEVAEQGDDEKAKSNDEFRKMFLKK
ncbi:similar to EMBRYO DEFECTIVE 140 [Actinidia rufa]|uniref:Similar to EMBRYO DEFECTIVE 140 n=1 Tax=Actinidia rufa TaxID=165716 RepID=A0A7J0F7I7_9ERIC|nr:similar to EMBRYO DEFECTIVE 140 [Actinidia rufa]